MSEIPKGALHPMTLLGQEAVAVFRDMGFHFASGPELEDEWHNFDVLNVAPNHPARDMQDTFWIKDGGSSDGEKSTKKVLRTHTTSVSARELERIAAMGEEGLKQLPYGAISIGKVFRNEATDITHEMQFYQIDGFMIGENIALANMKTVLTKFYKAVLGEDTEIAFRPSFFPFTEPSVEVWAKFKDRWLEMMGGGMIHPNVLRNAGLDHNKVQGFAFGGGMDRIAMIRWNIPDVRLLYQGDLRFNQF